MKQKSSMRGRPTCSTTKLSSGKLVAAWSTSATSKASLSSGQIVGPLWMWMLPQARLALAWIPAAVDHQLAGVPVEQRRVLLDVVEPVGVPLPQVRRLEDRAVDVALAEDVPIEVLLGVLHELLDRPMGLGRPEALVGVEALDPALGVLLRALHPVLRARVPEVDVAVHHEVLLAVLLVHGVLSPA
jgi:hypothetical protein